MESTSNNSSEISDSEKSVSEASNEKKSKKRDKAKYVVLKDEEDLMRHLELMHDRCITRNLQAAGLGGLDPDQEELVYGNLDPNAKMITGETILMAVLYKLKDQEKQVRYISILLNEGADPNHIDIYGKTALMHACTMSLEKSAKSLINHDKTDLTLKDHKGNTALILAASNGLEKVVKSYIKELRKNEKKFQRKRLRSNEENCNTIYGSTTNIADNIDYTENVLETRNNEGENAIDIANNNEHYECVKILEAEKLYQVKLLQRKLISLNQDKRRNSNSAIASMHAARNSLARRYTKTFGSFDNLFDRNNEDKSDDELMTDKITNFSHRISISANTVAHSHPNLSSEINQNIKLPETGENNQKIDLQQEIHKKVKEGSLSAGVMPDFEKLSFWSEFFPHTRLNNQTLAPNPASGTMRKSNTESSLTSYQRNHLQSLSASPAKRTLAQRLVGLLKRRSKQKLPTSTDGTFAGTASVDSARSKLRKGASQPELIQHYLKDNANAGIKGNFDNQNYGEKRRNSIGMPNGTSGAANTSVSAVPAYTITAGSSTNKSDTSLAMLDAMKLNKADESGSHASLKSKSSLPAISKQNVPNKLPLSPYIEEALKDTTPKVNYRSRRRKSFDILGK